MNIFRKLKQQIDEMLTPIPLYEMSMAFHYKDRRIDVCAWVENPMATDNQYFKYYDNSLMRLAKKVARIRLDRPEYVGGIHKERNFKKWILTNKEKQELVQILQGESEDQSGYTRWQELLMTYNRDNFNISFKDSKQGNLQNHQRDPKMPDYIQPYDINTPMPNYLELS